MTKDEAVSKAQDFVKSNCPVMPPVVMVQHVTKRHMEHGNQLQVENWIQLPGAKEMQHAVSLHDLADSPAMDVSTVLDKWIIAFRLSGDTDAGGLPEHLVLAVDDSDFTVRRIG